MRFQRLGRSVSVALLLLASLAALAQVPLSQHVVLVIDENTTFNDVIANMPWLVSKGNANGYASNYHSDNSGSLMDYLWLASGSCHSSANCTLPARTHNFNCSGNDCFYPGTATADPITDDNIFRLMNNVGISWKVYAQSYALAGGTLTTADNQNGTFYYRRHNAATWYSDVLNNVDGSASKVVDLTELATDAANGRLPRFTIIVPDGNHDAHDCPVGMVTCSVPENLASADEFLSSTLSPILSAAEFQPGGSGLLFVTFDECAGGTNEGCGASVYTAVIGPQVKPHTISVLPYKHENTLRTMLAALGITTLPGAAATAAEMSDFFTTSRQQTIGCGRVAGQRRDGRSFCGNSGFRGPHRQSRDHGMVCLCGRCSGLRRRIGTCNQSGCEYEYRDTHRAGASMGQLGSVWGSKLFRDRRTETNRCRRYPQQLRERRFPGQSSSVGFADCRPHHQRLVDLCRRGWGLQRGSWGCN